MNIRSRPVNRHSPECIVLALLVPWLSLASSASSATTYFVDANHPSARDTNPGTEALPFKTIGKAATVVNAGDTVFVKAGVYREMVRLSRSGASTTVTGRMGTVTTSSPITFMVYPGHEGKAIINAAEPVTNWRKCAGPQDCAGNPYWEHIYWADVAALVQAHPDSSFAVRQVFQHGKRLPRSRYPDTRWNYPTSMPDPMKRFVDSSLSQPSGYFTGAVCHIRTSMSRINQIPITAFAGATITLASSPHYAMTTRFGYYITSIVGEINAEGEWAYDPAKKRIYLWPQGDVAEDVEFSYREYCLRTSGGTAWNVVRGLTMRYAYQFGIFLYRASNVTLESNTVEHAYTNGIRLYAADGGTSENNQILRNIIKHCCYYGILIDAASTHTNIEGNYIYATGAESFGADLMNGRGEAIHVSGPYTRVYNNRIDRTGHNGIYLYSQTLGREVSYNYLTRTHLALSDGGGIYTGGIYHLLDKDHIHHNILVDVMGCLTMDQLKDTGVAVTSSAYSGAANGIYLDDGANDRLVEDNTVIGASMAGVFFHWVSGDVLQRNTLYGNGRAQIYFNGNDEPGQRLTDIVVQDNILFATSPSQKTLYIGNTYTDAHFGRSDRNYFYHPYNDLHISVNYCDAYGHWTGTDLPLREWQALSGYDVHSREFSSLEQRSDVILASPRMSRIIYNPTLAATTIDLQGKMYCALQGNKISGAVVLQPFESRILVALAEPTPEPTEPTTDGSTIRGTFWKRRP